MSEGEKKLPFIPEEWSNAASSVSCSSLQPVIALVCGPKNSGKSTFSRNLVEVLLQRLLLLLLQPLFIVPSLLTSVRESEYHFAKCKSAAVGKNVFTFYFSLNGSNIFFSGLWWLLLCLDKFYWKFDLCGFYRYKRVAYLDTDVGQPEFTAPGFLSLTVVDKSILGTLKLIALTSLAVCIPKTCFHNAISVTYVFGLFLLLFRIGLDSSMRKDTGEVVWFEQIFLESVATSLWFRIKANYSHFFFIWWCRCFFYGDVSSKRDPKAYLRYVYTLFDYYQLHFCKSSENKTELPLVINTPGWVKGNSLSLSFHNKRIMSNRRNYRLILSLIKWFTIFRNWLWVIGGRTEICFSFPRCENQHLCLQQESTSWVVLVRR